MLFGLRKIRRIASSGVLGPALFWLLCPTNALAALSPEVLGDLTVEIRRSSTCSEEQHAGRVEANLERLSDHARARREAIARFEAEAAAELQKLRAEHRALMLKAGTHSDYASNDVDGKWAVELYTNVASQAAVRQSLLDRIAKWDAEHRLEIARH